MPIQREDQKETHAARRLCELFKGRFSEDVAKKLIEDLGGELEAVDFVLNEKADVVSRYLKKNTEYVEDIRCDSKKIANLLENGIEYEVRQFACESCSRTWWKKVPYRKQVSKCFRCRVKYDPVPQEKEWGWAKFVCVCTNIFHAFGEMNVTVCECYKCKAQVPVEKVLSPRRRIGTSRKSNKPHSCNGVNCFSHDDDYINDAMGVMNMTSYKSTHASHHNNITYNNNFSLQPGQASGKGAGSVKNGKNGKSQRSQAEETLSDSTAVDEVPICIHPKSNEKRGKRIRTPSKKHISTGSTVNTFLTQGSLDTASVAFTLDRIDEI